MSPLGPAPSALGHASQRLATPPRHSRTPESPGGSRSRSCRRWARSLSQRSQSPPSAPLCRDHVLDPDLKMDGFGLDTCCSMVAVMDGDDPGFWVSPPVLVPPSGHWTGMGVARSKSASRRWVWGCPPGVVFGVPQSLFWGIPRAEGVPWGGRRWPPPNCPGSAQLGPISLYSTPIFLWSTPVPIEHPQILAQPPHIPRKSHPNTYRSPPIPIRPPKSP